MLTIFMEKGCAMKGFLEFQVLNMINKKNLSGQEIRKEIGKRKGCTPSPGTIYPVLKELRQKALIKELDTKSKEKKYKITKKGQHEVQITKKMFHNIFKELF